MDDLIISGIVALVVFYAGIIVVAIGIFKIVVIMAQALILGNYLFVGMILAGIVATVLVYFAIGLLLRKTGTI
ncbi:MAG TPA: hypothetical protein PKM50_02045 [Methanoregula sp.]|nr:hypothetical protein [Methanoregula sp.]